MEANLIFLLEWKTN